ncbi:MAG: hypothetical protein ABW019_18575, partial [Chitinophagaceae bacterium]
RMLPILLNAGYIAEAEELAGKIVGRLYQLYQHYSAMEYYRTKDSCLDIFRYIAGLLKDKNIATDSIDRTIRMLENE